MQSGEIESGIEEHAVYEVIANQALLQALAHHGMMLS